MGDSGFQVEPGALERYSSLLAEQAEQLERIAAATAAITISSDAFGHLPNAQHLAAAYQEHAGASRENVGVIGSAVNGSAHGLSGVSRNYTDHEDYLAGTMGGGR
ncbi:MULTISPECIES: hypothetical protein [Kitasatospora]|uniref:ESX-1 secretion-associated protein n=1 Tax=Kitasatospora setae (strain ATCC 33774 / DSM 43861 / JCM 3304 / KCC A-0304 / NBRC 14216 / KM-6054) TaxID=452652 RepID=E4N9K1_KITSK|nr:MULTISPECIES: hypothetical protein [Kitasatospora]BAJ27882.1 hypothetical protein KSE_20590 [Kitasatospora setae KM-6054]